jgi:2,4-dienoyl-CoA reductase-like NADH-dependent reductase (Old Yellow Enzyme family)
MDFIFMLTRQDRTVEDCLAVVARVAPLGLKHIGFKDIGVDVQTLRALNTAIQSQGALSYLEVVATSAETALHSAEVGAAIGVDHILGGTQVEETLQILGKYGVEYFPFPGLPSGHPTRLDGDAAMIEAHTQSFLAQGCAGVDLLAYRATQADPLELIQAARRACGKAGKLICAGDINSPARVQALRAAGVDAFTIGSAAFDGSFVPGAGDLLAQLREIIACA